MSSRAIALARQSAAAAITAREQLTATIARLTIERHLECEPESPPVDPDDAMRCELRALVSAVARAHEETDADEIAEEWGWVSYHAGRVVTLAAELARL